VLFIDNSKLSDHRFEFSSYDFFSQLKKQNIRQQFQSNNGILKTTFCEKGKKYFSFSRIFLLILKMFIGRDLQVKFEIIFKVFLNVLSQI
jgi:hypothetical protein